ncbi:hypothetical protein SCHPADRAFT_335257 [Schizopora paradoxa]|uniref:Uncharacterized protein n=1 Tax=Schizopora paradoxa TaxID=27342 RepID=A0A0H2RQ89_9AGAM|nr:hypothetical protein SCHPADRAFT_335257 [Schizopora paradoxa]
MIFLRYSSSSTSCRWWSIRRIGQEHSRSCATTEDSPLGDSMEKGVHSPSLRFRFLHRGLDRGAKCRYRSPRPDHQNGCGTRMPTRVTKPRRVAGSISLCTNGVQCSWCRTAISIHRALCSSHPIYTLSPSIHTFSKSKSIALMFKMSVRLGEQLEVDFSLELSV